MPIFEEVILSHTIEIDAPPQAVFDFLTGIHDDESYKRWHPQDHVAFRWVEGEPWREGSVVYAEEILHGELHKLTFVVTKYDPPSEIVYEPKNRILRFYFPGNRFLIEASETGSTLLAEGRLKIGKLARFFAGKKLEKALASVQRHMKEEDENLKRIVEQGF